MIKRFLQIHLAKPNPCCIAWSRQQKVSANTWTQTKRSICVLNEEESSPCWIFILWNLKTYSCNSTAVSHLLLLKTWTAIDWLSIIWKFNFISGCVSTSVHGCTTWTLTKSIEENLNVNSIRMLHAILKKFWEQHSTKQEMVTYLPSLISSK